MHRTFCLVLNGPAPGPSTKQRTSTPCFSGDDPPQVPSLQQLPLITWSGTTPLPPTMHFDLLLPSELSFTRTLSEARASQPSASAEEPFTRPFQPSSCPWPTGVPPRSPLNHGTCQQSPHFQSWAAHHRPPTWTPKIPARDPPGVRCKLGALWYEALDTLNTWGSGTFLPDYHYAGRRFGTGDGTLSH